MELTLELAKSMIDRAIDTATTGFGRPICVSVCDSRGLLLAFNRVEGGNFRSVDMSQAKAYTAVRMGVDTDVFLERLQRENLSIAYFYDTKMTALPGGVALKDGNGNLVGGIGISGLKADEDAAVARTVADLAKVP